MKNPFSTKLVLVCIFISLFISGIAFVEIDFINLLELKLLDLRFLIRGPITHSNQVAIIAIDDKSLSMIGRWPWKRNIFADLINILNNDNAKVIAFDIIFEKDVEHEEDEVKFVNALKKSGKVLLPVYFNLNREEAFQPSSSHFENINFPKISHIEKLKKFAFIKGYDLFPSYTRFNEVVRDVGHINILPDKDGITRKTIFAIEYQGHYCPSFSLKIAQKYLDNTNQMIELMGDEGIKIASTFIPISPISMDKTMIWGMKYINYRGKYKTFPYYSFYDVLHQQYPKDAFLNKIVLVGSTSAGLYDNISTSFSNIFPGIELQANVIDNILKNDFLSPPWQLDFFNVFLCLILGISLTFILPRVKLSLQIFTVLISTLSLFIVSFLLFIKYAIWLNIIYPLFTILVISLTILFISTIITRREYALLKEKDSEVFEILFAPMNRPINAKINNVLIVDNHKELLNDIKDHANKNYKNLYNVFTVTDGIEAVEMVKNNPISVVVTDILQKINEDYLFIYFKKFYPDISLIITDGTKNIKRKTMILKKGMDEGYFEKPFEISELTKNIKAVLQSQSAGGILLDNSSDDFMQFIQGVSSTKKTHTLRAVNKQNGKYGALFFKNGILINGRINDLQGEKAVFEILSWDIVDCSIENGCKTFQKLITNKNLQAIIMEALRLKDEKRVVT